MQPFLTHHGRVALLRRANIDTDQIIPKQFLKSMSRSGYGPMLFHDWRYLPDGTPNPDFPLNRADACGASVLLTGDNFGCGSSREHAAWALAEFGFRAIIAPSFADLFFGNCCQNGLLPVALPDCSIEELGTRARAVQGYQVTVDLDELSVRDGSGFDEHFQIDAYHREMLMLGLDEIGRTLLEENRITEYERNRPASPVSATP